MFAARDNPSGVSDLCLVDRTSVIKKLISAQSFKIVAFFVVRFLVQCPLGLKGAFSLSSDVTFRLRQNLMTLLKERGMTASQLSRKTGVAKQVLSDWMSGVQPRKIEQLYLVAKELGVSIEAICFTKSEEELLGIISRSSRQGYAAGSSGESASVGMTGDLLKQAVISPDEIRGRFEVHLRRITDE